MLSHKCRNKHAQLRHLLLSLLIAAFLLSIGNVKNSSHPKPSSEHRRLIEQERTTLPAEQQKEITTKKKKPRFVIHFGPMKTATSSLQADLDWKMGKFLEQDGWYYIKLRDPMNNIHMDKDNPELFLEQFKREADKLLVRNQNIIRSREQYSALFSENAWMYERLHDLLSDDWDVTIVAGYRPYHEWISSFRYQAKRMKYSDPKNPQDRVKNHWRKENGKLHHQEPMFPSFYKFWTAKPRFTKSIIEQASPHFPVKVFDMRDPIGMRSAFLCDALGEGAAPVSCRESLKMDLRKPPGRVNKSNEKELQYDAIALAAVSRGLVDEYRWRRSEIIDAIEHQQETVLKKKVVDFPLICPDDETYKEFWERTLRLDQFCMPQSKRKARDERENKLRENFQAAVDKKKFCHVDVDSVLDNEEWRQFFQQYAPKPEAK